MMNNVYLGHSQVKDENQGTLSIKRIYIEQLISVILKYRIKHHAYQSFMEEITQCQLST